MTQEKCRPGAGRAAQRALERRQASLAARGQEPEAGREAGMPAVGTGRDADLRRQEVQLAGPAEDAGYAAAGL